MESPKTKTNLCVWETAPSEWTDFIRQQIMLILAKLTCNFLVKFLFPKTFATDQMILNHKRVSFKHSSTLRCTVLWKELLSDQRGEQEARQQALPPLQPCTQWAAFVHTQRKAVRVKTVDTLLRSNYMHTIGFNSRTLSKCQLTPAPARWWLIRPHVGLRLVLGH